MINNNPLWYSCSWCLTCQWWRGVPSNSCLLPLVYPSLICFAWMDGLTSHICTSSVLRSIKKFHQNINISIKKKSLFNVKSLFSIMRIRFFYLHRARKQLSANCQIRTIGPVLGILDQFQTLESYLLENFLPMIYAMHSIK